MQLRAPSAVRRHRCTGSPVFWVSAAAPAEIAEVRYGGASGRGGGKANLGVMLRKHEGRRLPCDTSVEAEFYYGPRGAGASLGILEWSCSACPGGEE